LLLMRNLLKSGDELQTLNNAISMNTIWLTVLMTATTTTLQEQTPAFFLLVLIVAMILCVSFATVRL
jgi:hypothetical protein